MSAIASFHLLPREDLEDLLGAAESQGVHPFLKSRATALRGFGDSGYAFNDLDLLLEPRSASLFGSMGLKAESERLSTALQASSALFDASSAQALLARLGAIELKPEEVAAFLASEHGSSDPAQVEAVLSAFVQAQEWLGQVQPDSIGLLSIG